ncbi:zinc ribbon domain-containing protein [Tissierella creatinini]|nr:zinc ribbon domain-containing protein [Tissierella creatinini]TJX60131.1 zinc ribbon domain-containing protein [Soehngenia saccharolytica]
MKKALYQKCIYCGKKIKSSAKFCTFCGKKSSFQEINEEISINYCPKCNEKLNPAAKFCRNCGESIAARKADNINAQNQVQVEKQIRTELDKIEELESDEELEFKKDIRTKEVLESKNKVEISEIIKDNELKNQEPNDFEKKITKGPAKSKNNKIAKKFRIKVIPAVIALSLILVSIGIYGTRDGFEYDSYLTSSFSSESEPIPWTSGTKAIEVTPMAGIKISAEENAMDIDREFQVSKIEDEELYDMFLGGDEYYFPLAGFDFESGMTSEDIFPGYIDISFDLEELNIPENLWEYVSIIRIEDNGDRTRLLTSLEDNQLFLSSRKNCAFVLALPFSTEFIVTATGLSTLGPAAVNLYNDIYRKFNYLGESYRKDTFLSYEIYWPTTMLSPNQAEVDRVNRELKALELKYGIDYKNIKSSNPYDHAAKLSRLFADESYKSLISLKNGQNSIEWKKANYWPARVTLAVEALERADKYLRDVRKFKMPKAYIDVLMLNDWPAEYGDAPAMHDGNFGQKGFIAVNLSDFMMLGYVKEALQVNNKIVEVGVKYNVQDKIDAMNMNLVHELFHTVQEEYIVKRSNSYLWFWEATALTLEYEANKYYTQKDVGWSAKENYSVDRSSWETFRNKLDDDTDNESMVRNHGYTASHLIEFLRDNSEFNQKGGNDYLRNVLESFSKFGSNAIAAIYDGAGSSSDDLSSKFYAFSTNRAEEMYKRISGKISIDGNVGLLEGIVNPLDENNPLFTWNIESKPLSVDYKVLSTQALSQERMKNSSVFIIPDNTVNYSDFDIYHNIRTGTGDWINVDSQIKDYKADTIKELELQRIDSNTTTQDIPENMSLKVLLMLQPQSLKAEVKDNLLNVEIEKSKLMEFLSNRGIEARYNIYIKVPGMDEDFIHKMEVGSQTAEIDISDKAKLGKAIAKANAAGENVEIVYREVVKFSDQDKSIAGPESKLTILDKKQTEEDDDLINKRWVKTETNSNGERILYQEISIEPYKQDGYNYIINCYFVETKENGNYDQITLVYYGKTSSVSDYTHMVDIVTMDGSKGTIGLVKDEKNNMTLSYFEYDSVNKGIITLNHTGYFVPE